MLSIEGMEFGICFRNLPNDYESNDPAATKDIVFLFFTTLNREMAYIIILFYRAIKTNPFCLNMFKRYYLVTVGGFKDPGLP